MITLAAISSITPRAIAKFSARALTAFFRTFAFFLTLAFSRASTFFLASAFLALAALAALATSQMSSQLLAAPPPKLNPETLAEIGAPPELAAWVPWVLYDQEEAFCPKQVDRDPLCVFAMSLEVAVNDAGGEFTGYWDLKDESLLIIPGQSDRWPTKVMDSVNGAEPVPIPVIGPEVPMVNLGPGIHKITGVFAWNTPAETLRVPMGPILSITVDGERLSHPVLDADPAQGVARVWLKRKAAPTMAPAVEGNRLDVQIDRLLVDSQPMSIRTRLRLIVAGASREETITDWGLAGAIPTRLDSPLPARVIGSDLRVQVSPGVHDVFIDARMSGPIKSLGPVSGKFAPERWAFAAQPWLRQVEVSGGVQIDKSLVEIRWSEPPATAIDQAADPRYRDRNLLRDYVTYELSEGESLSFAEIRRGDPEPGPDSLNLERRCWLDFDGKGLTCRDNLHGVMRRQWHLSADKPFTLGQASLNGEPQVITWQINSKGESAPGLQLRQGSLQLTADLRIDDFNLSLPASGWDHNLDTVRHSIMLPPGFELLKASGAVALDSYYTPLSWWDRWSTLDMFIVLAVVLATLKLLGLKWAALACFALALSYHEFMAPRLVLLHVLGATALLTVLPQGKARWLTRAWRFLAVLVMVFFAVAFIILQIRLSMYPQLEVVDTPRVGVGYPPLPKSFEPKGTYYASRLRQDNAGANYDEEYYDEEYYELDTQKVAKPSISAVEDSAPSPRPSARSQGSPESSMSMAANMPTKFMIPELMAQNSLPRPEWYFKEVTLDFNDQISKDQTVKLTLISPGSQRVLRWLRSFLLGWLVLALAAGLSAAPSFLGPLARLTPKPGPPKSPPPTPGAPGSGTPLQSSAPSPDSDASGSSDQISGDSSSQASPVGRLINPLAATLALLMSALIGLASISAILLVSTPASAQVSEKPSLGFAGPDQAIISDQLEAAPTRSRSISGQSSATFPSPEILNELRLRLLRDDPLPAPSIPSITLQPGSDPGTIKMRIAYEAAQSVLLPLPIIDNAVARLAKAQLESTGAALPLAYGGSGEIVALVPEGVDAVVIEASYSLNPGFQIRFINTPKKFSLTGFPDWSAQGLDPEERPAGNAIFIETNLAKPAEDDPKDDTLAAGGQSLEPFFLIERVVSLGLDWKILTTVTRFGQGDAPATVSVPLIPGESLTTPYVAVSQDRTKVIINFLPGAKSMRFESSFPKNLEEPITLLASEGPYTESWILDAANLWRVETSGLVPIHNLTPDGVFNPQWRPWPGESLSISVSRPEPVPGQYLVIDQTRLATNIGTENRRHTLYVQLRSSQGGSHSIFIPKGVEILSLSLNDRSLPIGPPLSSDRGLEIPIPLVPGERQLELVFLETAPLTAITRTPIVDLGTQAANIHYNIDLPEDRWLLFTGGPVQGPAVLFWSFASAMLILSLVLSRLGTTPLGTLSWFLLLIGLSQLNLVFAFVVAGWLLALGLRSSNPLVKSNCEFNSMQIILALWTGLTLVLIYQGLQHALLAAPSMRVTGNGSWDRHLSWFSDRSPGILTGPWALIIPNKVYQYIMLAWSLWLAISIIRWLRWAWKCFSAGAIWRRNPPRPKPPKTPRGPAGSPNWPPMPPPGHEPPPSAGYGPAPQGGFGADSQWYGPAPQGGTSPSPPPFPGAPQPQSENSPPFPGAPQSHFEGPPAQPGAPQSQFEAPPAQPDAPQTQSGDPKPDSD